jgi:cytochrome c oxidase subunit IV
MSTAHAPAHDATHAHHADDGAVHPHIMPVKVLVAVYVALVILTVLTVAITKVSFGNFNVGVALGIAVLKAALVILYFMHVKYDAPFTGLIVIVALMFVGVFIWFAMQDTSEYKVNYDPPGTRVMITSQTGG